MTSDLLELKSILSSIPPEPNWRVVLDHEDNTLTLRVETRKPWRFEVRRHVILSYEGTWEPLRQLQAPTYEAMLAMVRAWPEFLQPRVEFGS